MAQLVKTIGGLALASCKTVGGLAIASAKTIGGLDNTGGSYDPATDPSVVQYLTANALAYADNTAMGNTNPWTATTGQNANGGSATFKTGILNTTLPVVRFNGTSDFLHTASFGSQSQPVTVAVVYRDRDGATSFATVIQHGATGGDWRIWNASSSFFPAIYAGSAVESVTPDTDTNWHIAMFWFDGASSAWRYDGGTKTTFPGSPGTDAVESLCLAFDEANGIRYGAMDIFAIVVRSGAADSTAENNIFDFFNNLCAIY